MKKFVTRSEYVAFDSTHIRSQSQNIELCQKGYNPADGFGTQVNLLYTFSIDKQQPNYYRLFPGNVQGIRALKLCIAESNISGGMAIGDKGFFSEQNLQILEDEEIQYVLPLRRSSKYIDYNRLNTKDYDAAFNGYFFYNERLIFYSSIEIKTGALL